MRRGGAIVRPEEMGGKKDPLNLLHLSCVASGTHDINHSLFGLRYGDHG